MTTAILDEDLQEELDDWEDIDDGLDSDEDDEDELSAEFVEDLITKILKFNDVLVGHGLHPYQEPFARRICQSVLINDGEELTALAARQSGKTETVADIVATLMILLPRLARIYPTLLDRFKDGLWVGMFAPVEGQVETMFSRTVSRLTSDRAREIMGDPEIDDKPQRAGGVVKTIKLAKSGSFVSMMTANPRAKIESRTFHLIVIDECFPAETPVLTSEGWVPIGEIANGERRDWIVATQEADGLGWARVRTAYRTPRHTPLVRVDHEHGSVYATANHPFVVDGEEVPAISLPVGAHLSVVSGADQPRPVSAREEGRAPVLLQPVPGAVAESDGGRRHAGVDVLDPPRHWAPPQGAGREWSRSDRATAETLGRATRGLGGRACLPHWRTNQGRSSDELQDRRGEPRVDGRRGDRRGVARTSASGVGRAQGPVAVGSRVVGVQVLEPGSPEFDQFSDRADYVYTLEVESESHTYIAGGVLVGNCQEADDFVVAKSIAPMLAYHAGTMVKTGTPTTKKNNFYRSVQLNKRRQTSKRGARQNHYQWDWKDVSKINRNYERFIRKEMLRIGEDSDEFQMSYNCVVPETKILTADLRWVAAGDLVVGQSLVGFDEDRPGKGTHRRIKPTTVEGTQRVVAECYRLVFSDGTEVTCTGDHRWLVSTAGRRTVWKTTLDLAPTDRVFKIVDTWEEAHDYRTGYLSAAFDGEGHFSRGNQLGFSQRENAMLLKVRKFMEDLGFTAREVAALTGTAKDVQVLHVAGGRNEIMRFLGQVRPERILDRLDLTSLGTVGRHARPESGFQHPTVVSRESVGKREVVVLETSTQTYVAEGLASHNCRWILERGMFTSQAVMDELGDTSMNFVRSWAKTPVVVGIDPARKTDSTVVTVVWVDWDRPDEYGYYDHRVLNWLELQGDDWEEQYAKIVDFLSHYNVLAVAVDANGVGDAVAQRLRLLLPRAEVHSISSSAPEQSKRFKHLMALMERRLIGWPAHANARRTRIWKKFQQQMLDAEKQYKGVHFSVAAPDEAWAHDDFVDSLALAVTNTAELAMPTVQVSPSPFYS